ncbi:MAG: nucleoside triphosphatase NudI [Holophagales bacterium]|nr:nucleoside triphosphatase NudI [Holophagales bacterium]
MTSRTETPPSRRLIVVAVAEDRAGRTLLCRMTSGRGVFPGRWALPGGGVEPGERLEAALEREIYEELGVGLEDPRPLLFRDAVLPKTLADGTVHRVHMVFLIYSCRLRSHRLRLNEEFSEYGWFAPSELVGLSLPQLTRETLTTLGRLPGPS